MKIKRQMLYIWDGESGLTTMLVLILAGNIILSNYLLSNKLAINLLILVWAFVIISGILTLVKTKRNKWGLLIVTVLSIAIEYIDCFNQIPALILTKLLLNLGIHSILLVLVWKKVFEPGDVTTHRIIGSIVVYLLIGNFFSKIYQYTFFNLHNAFVLPGFESISDVTPATFIYFSYTTLTSTGFGDIVPSHAITRQLVIAQQLIGVLYPVVLIGRLVSLKK